MCLQFYTTNVDTFYLKNASLQRIFLENVCYDITTSTTTYDRDNRHTHFSVLVLSLGERGIKVDGENINNILFADDTEYGL